MFLKFGATFSLELESQAVAGCACDVRQSVSVLTASTLSIYSEAFAGYGFNRNQEALSLPTTLFIP